MEFAIVAVTERHVHLTLQGFEGQVRLLHALGYHQNKPQFVEDLRRMIVALNEAVEETKEIIIEEINEAHTAIADDVNGQREMLAAAAEQTSEPVIVELSGKLTEAQPKIVHQLGMQEGEMEKKILQRFKIMFDKIQDLQSRVEKIRC